MIINPYKAAFIVFEGIDFSGKSTQFLRLQNYLTANHPKLPVAYTKEPDDSIPSGQEIYQILKGEHKEYDIHKMEPFHMQAFYMKNRMINYRDKIILHLQAGRHDLQDRGVASSVCYGSKTPKDFYGFVGMHDLIFSAASVPFIWPDKVVIVDIPAEAAVERAKSAGRKLDAMETLENWRRVRTNYLAFANLYPNCVVVDGTKDVNDVSKEVQGIVLPLLGLNK